MPASVSTAQSRSASGVRARMTMPVMPAVISSSVPCALSWPNDTMTASSMVWAISERRWEETSTVRPSPAR